MYQQKKQIVDFNPAGSAKVLTEEQKELQRIKYIKSLRQTVEPLTKEYFLEVLHLEERVMFDDNYSQEHISQLVALYAKAVEHYDSLKDPISVYFLEKIQMTLASHETLQLMHQKRKKIRDSISRFESMGKSQLNQVFDENDSELLDMGNSSLYKSKLRLTSNNSNLQGPSDFYQKKDQYKKLVKQEKDQRYSISKKKKERQKKIEQYQEQKDFFAKNNTETMFKISEINSQKINNIIQSDLDAQESSVLERLKLRKYQKQLQNSRKKQEEMEKNQNVQEQEHIKQFNDGESFEHQNNYNENQNHQHMKNIDNFNNIDHSLFYKSEKEDDHDDNNCDSEQMVDNFNDFNELEQNKENEEGYKNTDNKLNISAIQENNLKNQDLEQQLGQYNEQGKDNNEDDEQNNQNDEQNNEDINTLQQQQRVSIIEDSEDENLEQQQQQKVSFIEDYLEPDIEQ